MTLASARCLLTVNPVAVFAELTQGEVLTMDFSKSLFEVHSSFLDVLGKSTGIA